jgi:hypothetical protein
MAPAAVVPCSCGTNEHVSYGLKIRVSHIIKNPNFKPRSPGSFCMDSGGPPPGDVLRRTLVRWNVSRQGGL